MAGPLRTSNGRASWALRSFSRPDSEMPSSVMPRSRIIGSAPRSSTLAASSRVAVCAVASASEWERVARSR